MQLHSPIWTLWCSKIWGLRYQVCRANLLYPPCVCRLSAAAQSTSQRWTAGWCLCRAATWSNPAPSGGWGARVCPSPRARLREATWWWSSKCSSLIGSHLSPGRSSSTAWASASPTASRHTLCVFLSQPQPLSKVLLQQPITTSDCV